MIDITFEFCTMYEPGELAPPQFELEGKLHAQVQAAPRFKDRVKHKDKEYMVWDVTYETLPGCERTFGIYIKAIRKVTYPPNNA